MMLSIKIKSIINKNILIPHMFFVAKQSLLAVKQGNAADKQDSNVKVVYGKGNFPVDSYTTML